MLLFVKCVSCIIGRKNLISKKKLVESCEDVYLRRGGDEVYSNLRSSHS